MCTARSKNFSSPVFIVCIRHSDKGIEVYAADREAREGISVRGNRDGSRRRIRLIVRWKRGRCRHREDDRGAPRSNIPGLSAFEIIKSSCHWLSVCDSGNLLDARPTCTRAVAT